MSMGYELSELLATFIECYILCLIYNDILHQYRRVPGKRYDIYIALIELVIITICNKITMFSYYTTIVFVVYMCIAAKRLYKTSYILLSSLISCYVLVVSYFDFFIFALLASLWDGTETFTELIWHIGPQRTLMLGIGHICKMIAYLSLRKFFHRIALKIDETYTVLVICGIGFLGYIFLTNQTLNAFHYSMTGVWLLLVILLALLFFY